MGMPFASYEPLLEQLAGGTRHGGNVYPTPDHVICGVPRSSEMTAILDDIDTSIADARPVYVHCWGGHGRTGTVIGCWLTRHGRLGSDALAEITALRRHDHYLREEPLRRRRMPSVSSYATGHKRPPAIDRDHSRRMRDDDDNGTRMSDIAVAFLAWLSATPSAPRWSSRLLGPLNRSPIWSAAVPSG